MSTAIDEELTKAARSLHRAVAEIPVAVPDDLEMLVGTSGRSDERGLRSRRPQAMWLAAAAVVAVLAVVGILVALRDSDTVSAGDPTLTAEQIAVGFAQSLEAGDVTAGLEWFEPDATISGEVFEPTDAVGPPLGLVDLVQDPEETVLLEEAIAVEDLVVRILDCEPTAAGTSCTVLMGSNLSELTALDGEWTRVWDLETEDGLISALSVAPHDDTLELDGIRAYQQWADLNSPELTEEEWIDLIENRPEDLLALEVDRRERFAEHLRSQPEAAVRLGKKVCADIAEGADPAERLDSAWRFARLVVPAIPPVVVVETIRAECGGVMAPFLDE